MIIQTLTHKRTKASIQKIQSREIHNTVDPNQKFNGIAIMLPHPFGICYIASLFDGEKIVTLQMSGGHARNPGLLTIQLCDTPLETRIVEGTDEFKNAIPEEFWIFFNLA